MDYQSSTKTYTIRLGLSAKELNLHLIDELCDKYVLWHASTEEENKRGGRKTRAASRRADDLYNEIMQFSLPAAINLQTVPLTKLVTNGTGDYDRPTHRVSEDSLETDVNISRYMTGLTLVNGNYHDTHSNNISDGESSGSRPNTRQMSRSRQQVVRTPVSNNRLRPRKQAASPMTPTNQSLRTFMKSQPGTGSSNSSGGSSVINAALNQQHPSLHMYKTRQLLNTQKQLDSAQKRRQEDEDRKRALLQERLENLARAEAQREQLKAERAQQARQRREERTRKVADVRAQQTAKAREVKKLEAVRTQLSTTHQNKVPATYQHNQSAINTEQPASVVSNGKPAQESVKPANGTQCDRVAQIAQTKVPDEGPKHKPQQPSQQPPPIQQQHSQQHPTKPLQLNATYERNVNESNNNIDISIADEERTMEEDPPKKPQKVADWARAPHLRDAIIRQFEQPTDSLRQYIFPPVQPVQLDKVFGPRHAVTEKYMRRTSSAVWSPPPNPSVKRSSSAVFTPDR